MTNPYSYTLTYLSGAARRDSKAPGTRVAIRVSGVAIRSRVGHWLPQADLRRRRRAARYSFLAKLS